MLVPVRAAGSACAGVRIARSTSPSNTARAASIPPSTGFQMPTRERGPERSQNSWHSHEQIRWKLAIPQSPMNWSVNERSMRGSPATQSFKSWPPLGARPFGSCISHLLARTRGLSTPNVCCQRFQLCWNNVRLWPQDGTLSRRCSRGSGPIGEWCGAVRTSTGPCSLPTS